MKVGPRGVWLVIFCACGPVSQAGDAGHLSDATLGADVAITQDEDAAPVGSCPSGNDPASATIIDDISALVGSWAITMADDLELTHRTLTFSAPLGSAGVACAYSDQGGMEMTYDDAGMGVPPGPCSHTRYRVRFGRNGAPNTFGFIEVTRHGLLPDGTPNPQPDLSSSYQFVGGLLNFDSEHFVGGAGYNCPH